MSSPAETLAFLREVRLFKDIADPELTALALTLRERPLKRGGVLFREGESVRLQPENDAYEPIISREAQVLGKVIGVFRKV